MKTTLHVLTVLAIIAIAVVQAQQWGYGDNVVQAEFHTVDVINKDNGTAKVTMVFTLDQHVDMPVEDSSHFVIAVFNETTMRGWAGKAPMYQYDKDYYLAGSGR